MRLRTYPPHHHRLREHAGSATLHPPLESALAPRASTNAPGAEGGRSGPATERRTRVHHPRHEWPLTGRDVTLGRYRSSTLPTLNFDNFDNFRRVLSVSRLEVYSSLAVSPRGRTSHVTSETL